MINRKLIIVVAEDDENDAALISRAIRRVDPDAQVFILENGVQVIRYLKAEGEFADRKKFPFPHVLITDLKMPLMNGFDLLAWLQEHTECKVIPSIVLSASDLPEDTKRAYQLGANAYFRKPNDFLHLVKLIEMNFNYWLEAQLPPGHAEMKCEE
jgi:CheY-like chemotaxis protein